MKNVRCLKDSKSWNEMVKYTIDTKSNQTAMLLTEIGPVGAWGIVYDENAC